MELLWKQRNQRDRIKSAQNQQQPKKEWEKKRPGCGVPNIKSGGIVDDNDDDEK